MEIGEQDRTRSDAPILPVLVLLPPQGVDLAHLSLRPRRSVAELEPALREGLAAQSQWESLSVSCSGAVESPQEGKGSPCSRSWMVSDVEPVRGHGDVAQKLAHIARFRASHPTRFRRSAIQRRLVAYLGLDREAAILRTQRQQMKRQLTRVQVQIAAVVQPVLPGTLALLSEQWLPRGI